MNAEKMERVTKENLCPVCQKADWCLVAADGSAAICQRVEQGSIKRCGEAGWLHIFSDAGRSRSGWPTRSIAIPQPPAKEFPSLAKRYQGLLKEEQLAGLANNLGVSAVSLKRLGVGWDYSGFSFPMSDASGRIIGIRIRYPSGIKAAERGSKQGLFIPNELPAEGLMLVCEGPTDAAAALDLGFAAAGRPSCNGSVRMLATLAKGRDVVIVGDSDTPGRKGAEALASELVLRCPTVRIIFPPKGIKDLRQWKANGLKREQLLSVINQSRPLRVVVTHEAKEGCQR